MNWHWFANTYHPYISISFFIFGAIWGSFINVLIYRLPLEKSIIKPGSHCPQCSHHIAWYDNIPIISYLILKGQCRNCQTSISIRYPLIELICAVLCWTQFQKFGLDSYLLITIPLSLALIAITFIDLDHFYIPDSISISGTVCGLIMSFVVPDHTWQASLLGIVFGAGILAAVLLGFKFITGREGMGWGDVKLLAMLGSTLGVFALPAIILLASVQGIIIGSLWLKFGTQEEQESHSEENDDDIPEGAIPFGPFLALGAFEWIYAQDILRYIFQYVREMLLS